MLLLACAIIATIGALWWSYIVLIASVHLGRFVGGSTLLVVWLPTAALWLAWGSA